MTREELMNMKAEIEATVGEISIAKMLEYYKKIMDGADEYLLGAEFDGMVYGYFTKEIPVKYCSCQMDHTTNTQYLRFRPHGWGAQEIATREDSICFGSTERVYTLYTCNTKKGYNSGYCFEKAVYEKYGMADQWAQDNKASTEGGDIRLNGVEVQLKYAEKGSLATITSTSKIIKRIEKILEITK